MPQELIEGQILPQRAQFGSHFSLFYLESGRLKMDGWPDRCKLELGLESVWPTSVALLRYFSCHHFMCGICETAPSSINRSSSCWIW
jgi:hypothetical protein